MSDGLSAYLAFVMIAAIVFASRMTGYLLGARIAEDSAARRLFDVLPGCAIAAVVAPVIFHAGPVEIAGLVLGSLCLWFTGSNGLALGLGLFVLISGAHLLG